MSRPRRLLTIGHSYAVALNRRLPHEFARVGAGRWRVTVAAPRFIHGDLRGIHLEPHVDDGLVELIPVPFYGSRFVHAAAYGTPLVGLLRRRWDLVHCWHEPYIVAGFQVAAVTPRRCPLVYWTHQNIDKRYPPPFSWFERFSLRRCAGWAACGQTSTDVLLARGYDTRPHRTIPLGVDLGHFRTDPGARARIRRELGWDVDGSPVVGFLGRFTAEKGIERLTRVLDELDTPWRALFVGGGPLVAALRSWSGAHGGRARIVTNVPHDDVPAYLNAMDVLCAPSQTTAKWREQLGRMLVEAFACGVPVIGSDSGEIPAVIGSAGIVVPEADEAAWANQLTGLLGNDELRRQLAGAGRERAAAFAWPVVAGRFLDFFDELCDGRYTSR